jgi:hypothetical protein
MQSRGNLLFRSLITLSRLLFCLAGGMCFAFVYDVEPLSQEKVYALERDTFSRTNDNFNREFPSFGEWVAEQEGRESRMKDYLSALGQKLGEEVAYTFDWSLPDPSAPMNADQWRCAYGD